MRKVRLALERARLALDRIVNRPELVFVLRNHPTEQHKVVVTQTAEAALERQQRAKERRGYTV